MASDCGPHRKALLEQVHALTLTPSGQLVSASADGSIRIWDLMRFRAIVALMGHTGSVLCCACVSGAYAEADAAAAAADANAAAADAADAAAAAAAAADADASVLFSADAKGELLRWSVRPLPVLGLAGGSMLPTARVHVTEQGGGVYALAFAASSLVVTAGADHRVRLWNRADLSAVATLDPSMHRASVFALAALLPPVLDDGAAAAAGDAARAGHTPLAGTFQLASADAQGHVVLWDVPGRRAVGQLTSGEGSVCALAADAEGWLHGAGGRGELLCWDAAAAVHFAATAGSAASATSLPPSLPSLPVVRCAAHSSGILSLIAAPLHHPTRRNGRAATQLLSGSVDGALALHRVPVRPGAQDLAEEPTTEVLSAHRGCVWSLATADAALGRPALTPADSSNPILLSGGADGKVSIWQEEHRESAEGASAETERSATAAAQGAKAEAAGARAAWRLVVELDCAAQAALALEPRPAVARSVEADAADDTTVFALLPLRGVLLAGLANGTVQLWRPPEGGYGRWECMQRCTVHAASVLCASAATPDGPVYCGSADCGISRLELRLELQSPRLEIQSPHAPPSVAPYPAPDPSPATLQDASAAVHPAGRAGRAGGLGLGASAMVRPSITLTHLAKEAHEAEIHAIVIYATERFVSASADATIRVWDARTLAPLYTLRARGRLEPIAHDGAVYALLLVPSPPSPPSPAGSAAGLRLLSGGGDRLIRVWDLASLEQQATLAGHRSFVCALAADAHRQRLFSASSDKTCIVWHLGTYERLRVLAGHRGGLYSLVVHEGRPCSGSLDETIRVWTLRD